MFRRIRKMFLCICPCYLPKKWGTKNNCEEELGMELMLLENSHDEDSLLEETIAALINEDAPQEDYFFVEDWGQHVEDHLGDKGSSKFFPSVAFRPLDNVTPRRL